MFCLSQLRLFIIALGFTLSVAGCGSGGLIVGDDPAEDTVEASNDTFTVEENSSVALLDVLANDAGDINTGSLSLTTTPQNGSASLNNGQIQYQPNRGFSGTDSLTYTVNDNDGASASATVTITVTQLQDTVTTVTATDDTLTVDQDSVSTTVDILANDTSTGTINVGSLVITTPPQDGTASVNNGQIQYQPNADFSGSDSLVYTVGDNDGTVSNTATLSITVTPLDDPDPRPISTADPIEGAVPVFAINVGGNAYTAADGTVYQADDATYYTDSNTSPNISGEVAGTEDDTLYQSERYAANQADFSYNIPLDEGSYQITLHFAEVFFTNAGSRNFSVYIEDELFIDSIDLFALNNQNFIAADHLTGAIEITDGEANIRFESHTENAQVSAIRISSVGEAGPVVDLAAGGAVYDANCAFCHGESGVQVPIGGADIDILIPLQESHVHLTAPDEPLDLVTYIDRYMFTFYPEAGCDDECLANLTAYIGSLDANYVPPEVIASCGDIEVGYGRRQMRLLQAKEYENTIADLFNVVVDASSAGVPVDTYVEGFANQVLTLVSESYANGYALLAGQIAEASADQNFAGVANCTGTVAECGEIFVDDFAYKVFRRPLTDEEKGRYLTLFDSAGSVEEGLTLAIETILGSPNFLYRSEAGQLVGDIVNPTAEEEALDDDSYVLTQYELATLLAYTYTGSTPDDELLTAAENNELRTAVDLQEQVDRLLELPEAREHFREFAKQWLSTDRIISVNKDDSFTSFTSDVRSSMSEEVLQIVSHVMFDDLSVSDFYSNFSFIDQTLADFYGIAGNFSDEFVKVEGLVDRGGILTSGAFMAGYATAVESSPIIRAVHVREDFLCQDVPPMPDDINSEREAALSALQNHINANGGVVTNRDYYQFLTEEDAACAFCHTEIINPHGFGMEDFDPVGLPRIEDSNGLTIDANGSLVGVETLDDGQVETFTGGRGLSDLVQSLDATKSCFAQKGLRFVLATGHEVFDGDNQAGPELTDEQKTSFNCALDTMTGAMTDSNDNPLAAFRALGMDDVVRFRK